MTKKVLLFLSCVFIAHLLSSQSKEMWGVFNMSNNQGLGSLFKIDSANGSTIVKNFKRTAGGFSGFTKASDGNYYGLRYENIGSLNAVLFKVDPTTNESVELNRFDLQTNFGEILGGLIEAKPGELWSSATYTGTNDDGIIFSYNIQADSFKVEYNLNSIGTDFPSGELMIAPNGKIYGLARGIKMSFPSVGGIFEIDPVTNTIALRYTFSQQQLLGFYPSGKLTLGPNGFLYGYNMIGGGGGSIGTLFRFDPQTYNVVKRLNFAGVLGTSPVGNPFFANNGKFYGTTSGGAANGKGALFEWTPGSPAVVKMDLGANSEKFFIDHEDANGRLLGSYLNSQLSIGGISSYAIQSNTYTNLLSAPYFWQGRIFKEAANRYYFGGEHVIEFDSLMTSKTYVTSSYRIVDGGDFSAALSLGPDQKLYTYHSSIDAYTDFIRVDPAKGTSEVFFRLQREDSLYNFNGQMLLHPNGKFYLAFSERAITHNPPPGSITRSGIVEIDILKDTVSLAYLFPNNMSDIGALVLDSNLNFYGLSRMGNKTGSRPWYLYKVNSNLDSVQVLRTFNNGSFNLFTRTGPIIDGNIILFLAQDDRIYRYFIQEDSLRSVQLGSGTERGLLQTNGNGKYYGVSSDRIIEYDLSSNTLSTLVDFGLASNFNVAGRTPSNLYQKGDILYGINNWGPTNRYRPAVFAIDLNASQNQLTLVHEFDSIEGRMDYADLVGPGFIELEVCRPAQIGKLSWSTDTICGPTNIWLQLDSSQLNENDYWALYLDSITSQPYSIDSIGQFLLPFDRTVEVIIRGEGGCSSSPSDVIRKTIVLDPSKTFETVVFDTLCLGANFINAAGDTTFNISSPLSDTAVISAIQTACDSLIITHIEVDSLDLNIQLTQVLFQSTTLSASATNVNYQWIDCDSNQAINGANARDYQLTKVGSYSVEISNGRCVDTSQCLQVNNVNHPRIWTLVHDTVQFSSNPFTIKTRPLNKVDELVEVKVDLYPNPTAGKSWLVFDQAFNGTLRVFNLSGQLIQEQTISESWKEEILIEDSGVYLLELKSNSADQMIRKLLVE